jgi:quinol monooxygenase YgiN
MTVILISQIKVKPGAAAQFEAAVKDFYAEMRSHEPGCLANIMHSPAEPPGAAGGAFDLIPPSADTYFFYEVYADEEAAAAHPQSDGFGVFMRRTADLIDGRIELQFLREIDRK